MYFYSSRVPVRVPVGVERLRSFLRQSLRRSRRVLAISTAQVHRNSSAHRRQILRQKVASAFLFGTALCFSSASSCAPFPLMLHPSFAKPSAQHESRSFHFCSPADSRATFRDLCALHASQVARKIGSFRLFEISAHFALLCRASSELTL